MEITCPRCETVFALPDELYAPGKKARCTNCGLVFAMDEGIRDSTDGPVLSSLSSAASPGTESGGGVKKLTARLARIRKPLLIGLAALLLAVILAGVGWWGARTFFGSTPDAPPAQSPAPESPAVAPAAPPAPEAGQAQQPAPAQEPVPAQDTSALVDDIAIEELRQFTVNNTEIGTLVIMEGFVLNSSKVHKANITVEAWLADRQGKVLARERQICGVSLPLYQLQSLSETHLREALNNRVQLLSNNGNVPPGGRVPFTVIFSSPPSNMHRFHLRVVYAEDLPEKGARSAPGASGR